MLGFNLRKRFSTKMPIAGKIESLEKRSPFRPDKRYNVLSLDGGGVRGLITTKMLAAIEEKIAQKTENPDFKIS